MDFSQDDFERLLLFEQARKTAEANYAENPLDVNVCVILFGLYVLTVYLYIYIFFSNFYLGFYLIEHIQMPASCIYRKIQLLQCMKTKRF